MEQFNTIREERDGSKKECPKITSSNRLKYHKVRRKLNQNIERENDLFEVEKWLRSIERGNQEMAEHG